MAEPTILVCDDDEPLRELMKVTLGAGYRFVEAVDGEAALAELARTRPDLALLDVMLPGYSGLDVLKAMRSDERLRDVPVIVVSAWQTPEDREAVIAAGADAFLAKPFELEDLSGMVQTLLERGR
jgi:two-component system, OmpR family, response regulator MtrA